MGKDLKRITMADDWDRASIAQRALMLFNAISDGKMDLEKIKRLLEVADQQDQIKLKVLHNAVVKCTRDYQADSSSAHLTDWQRAEAALEAFVLELWEKLFGTAKSLATILAVVDYLDAEGWKATKSTVHRHQKEGKLLPGEDGTFQIKDVDKYAKTWLKQKSTGRRVNEKADELQRQKLEKELRSLDLDIQRKERQESKEAGNLVPREQIEIELATRAGILDAGLRHWIQAHAAEWIRQVAGDTKKVGDLINLMGRDLDEYINAYASTREYQVIIDAAKEEELATIDGVEGSNCG
jgi:hypothetical protein